MSTPQSTAFGLLPYLAKVSKCQGFIFLCFHLNNNIINNNNSQASDSQNTKYINNINKYVRGWGLSQSKGHDFEMLISKAGKPSSL